MIARVHRTALLSAMLFVSSCFLASARAQDQAASTRAAFQYGVGIHVGQNRNPPDATRAAFDRIGINSFRDEVFWHRLETKRGVLAFPDSLRDLDQLVTDAAKQGIRPLLILNYGNKLYDEGGQPHSPEGIAAYVRYVRFVVRHFRGRVDQFEIWNEWNIGGGGTREQHLARYGSPQDYAALLRAAYTAIKVENPAATVIGGAFAGYDYRWIDAFARAGGFNALDGFSIHPYVFSEMGAVPRAPRGIGVTGMAVVDRVLGAVASDAEADIPFRPAPGTPESALRHVDELKSRLDALVPDRHVSIYITEAGWPVHEGPHGVSEATAAAYLQRFLLLARTRPWISGVWWYDLFDDGDNPQDKEHRFGLIARDATPKPALQAFAEIAPLLAAPSAPTLAVDGKGRMTVRGQRVDGKNFVASWPATGNQRMEVTAR